MSSIHERFFLRGFLKKVSILALSASFFITVIYSIWGKLLITSIYNGQSIDFLNSLIKHQHILPLSHYISMGNHIIIMLWILSILVGILAFSIKYIHIKFRIVSLLIAADLLLLVPSLFLGRIFDVGKDLGIPELFQYFKEFVLAAMVLGIYLKNRKVFFLNLSLLFLVMLINDMMEVNAYIACLTAECLNLSSILEANNIFDAYTQVITYAIFGAVFAVTYFTNSNREYTRIYNRYAVLLFLLAFFGIILDGVSEMTVGDIFNTMENFGEMIAMSLLFAYTVFIRNSLPARNESSN